MLKTTIPRILLATALVLALASPPATPQTVPASGTVEAHLGKGYEAMKQEQYEAAAAEFRAALALDPTLSLRARFPLAVALFELHKSAEARREFESVRGEAGDHPNIFYYLGRLDLDEKHLPEAVVNLEKAAAQPPFPDTAYYLGYAYWQQNKLPEAEKWLKQAAAANPQDSRAPYLLASVYRKEGKEEEAKKTMAAAAELYKTSNDLVRLKQECAEKLEQGPIEEAHALCDQLYDPEDAAKLTALGTIYGQHGDLEAALKPLRRAAELSPESPQVQFNLAFTYFQLNQFDAARGPLEGAVRRWPDLFQLNALYAAVLLKLGEDAAAYPVLRHAHELNPQDAGTLQDFYLTALRLAKKSQDARRYAEAIRYCQDAARLKPAEPEPHRQMAEIQRLAGKAAEAAAQKRLAERLSRRATEVQ
ncbi:MAG TPA: tetratricopeptide repeat protein [Terriglobales bacterium]|jgi:tetratricopeptide (TPR) repeat protein